MDKPGRNDPCYCGSGKKYKQCHLPLDLAAEQQARRIVDAARELRIDLLDFAEEEQFDDAVAAALPRFWDNYYTAETAHLMDAFEADRFYDWFLFDYRPDDDDWTRPAEQFAQARSEELNPQQKDLLTQWLDAPPMGAYVLQDYEGQRFDLQDYLSGEAVEVYLPSGHGEAPIGSLIIGRLVPINERQEFFTIPAYIPPEEIDDLEQKLRDAMAEVAAADPKASPAEQLRRVNVIIMAHGLQEAKLDGRPPVARLDPNRPPETFPLRERHERLRIQGPAGSQETRPHMAQTRKKAI